MKNTSSYFGKNNRFENAWSNAEWTLPSVGFTYGDIQAIIYVGKSSFYKSDLTDLTK